MKVITEREQDFRDIGWEHFSTVEEALPILQEMKYVGLDIETTSLSFMLGEMILLQLGNYEHQFLIDVATVSPKLFKKLIEKKPLLGQNLSFDLVWLYKEGIIPDKIYDTYLAEYVLTMGRRLPEGYRGLGSLVERYCDVVIDKSMQKNIHEVGILNYDALVYSGNDIKYLGQIAEGQQHYIRKYGLGKAVSIENRFCRVVAYMEFSGVRVDKDAWIANVRYNEYDEYKTWLELTEYYKQHDPTPAVFPDSPVNWKSSLQVCEVFEKLGIDVVDPKTGKRTVEEGWIEKQTHPIIPLYLAYRGANKQVTTYGRDWLENILSDGRVHTKYKSMVDTGRTSCGNTKKGPYPNMQNLPNEDRVRRCFIAGSRNVLVACDYSSQESVLLADMSKEPNLLEFYINGGADLHSYAASKIWKHIIGDTPIEEIKDKFKNYRQLAKASNFAIAYGGTGFTISNNLNISKEEGDKVYEEYMKAFPGLAKFFEAQKRRAFNDGFIRVSDYSGRIRFVDGIDDVKHYLGKVDWDKFKEDPLYKEEVNGYQRRRGGIEREAMNSPIQGTAAEMSKLAGVYFFEWILENKLFNKVYIPIFVHDEYVAECPKNKADMVAEALQFCMETAGEEFLSILKIKAEPQIGQSWPK